MSMTNAAQLKPRQLLLLILLGILFRLPLSVCPICWLVFHVLSQTDWVGPSSQRGLPVDGRRDVTRSWGRHQGHLYVLFYAKLPWAQARRLMVSHTLAFGGHVFVGAWNITCGGNILVCMRIVQSKHMQSPRTDKDLICVWLVSYP